MQERNYESLNLDKQLIENKYTKFQNQNGHANIKSLNLDKK